MRLYRVMCESEFVDLTSSHRFGAGPGSLENGKWFATSYTDARTWGECFERLDGVPHRHIVSVDVPDSLPASDFFVLKMLDGIGPAVFVGMEALNRISFTIEARA